MPLGIPHSEFLTWSSLDQDKALAHARDQLERCPSCGTRHEDWERDRLAFVADAYRCSGCEAIEQEQANLRVMEEEDSTAARGMHVRLIPRARQG